jgi:hypothetical protein
MTKCPRCDRDCTEERIRQRRDGSIVVRAIHEDGTKDHVFFGMVFRFPIHV